MWATGPMKAPLLRSAFLPSTSHGFASVLKLTGLCLWLHSSYALASMDVLAIAHLPPSSPFPIFLLPIMSLWTKTIIVNH